MNALSVYILTSIVMRMAHGLIFHLWLHKQTCISVVLDISKCQYYRTRKEALNVLQCAICGEASLWGHLLRLPKLDRPSECAAFFFNI